MKTSVKWTRESQRVHQDIQVEGHFFRPGLRVVPTDPNGGTDTLGPFRVRGQGRSGSTPSEGPQKWSGHRMWTYTGKYIYREKISSWVKIQGNFLKNRTKIFAKSLGLPSTWEWLLEGYGDLTRPYRSGCPGTERPGVIHWPDSPGWEPRRIGHFDQWVINVVLPPLRGQESLCLRSDTPERPLIKFRIIILLYEKRSL